MTAQVWTPIFMRSLFVPHRLMGRIYRHPLALRLTGSLLQLIGAISSQRAAAKLKNNRRVRIEANDWSVRSTHRESEKQDENGSDHRDPGKHRAEDGRRFLSVLLK